MSEEASKSNGALRVLLVSLLVLIVVFVVLVGVAFRASASGTQVSLDRLYQLAGEGRVVSATLLDEDAVMTADACAARVSAPLVGGAARVCRAPVSHLYTAYPRSDVSTQQLIDRVGSRAPVSVDRQTSKAVAKLVLTFLLPLMILANLFGIIFVSRGGDSSLAAVTGFGKIGRKRQREKAAGTGVTFADVAGQDEVIVELREVIEYLKEPARFEAVGAVAPKGVLLFGPPGCGKTLLARAVAGESGVPFVSVSGTDFVESLVGIGAARVRDLFGQVRELAPAIVFIDELDAVGARREGGGQSGGEREQTLNQLLVEMDGFDVASGIVLMAATNRPDILDPALMRPGRFDRHITLEPPDLNGRREILAVHTRSRPISADVDMDLVARRTPGFSGADLANVINEAALLALRNGAVSAEIAAIHVSEAIQRVLHGPHKGKLMKPQERERIAFHESGHAIVAAAAGQAEQVQRVSIVARGRGVGATAIAGEGDRVLLTAEECEANLATAMGGIAAETLIYGRASTSAADDIERASALAKDMVGVYGMSLEIGPVRVLNSYGGYLDGASSMEAVSERTLEQFDKEVKALINAAQAHATGVLQANRAQLEQMAELLQEEETLEGAALAQLLGTVPVTPTTDGSALAPTPTPKPPAAKGL